MSHLFDTLEWASGSFSPHLEDIVGASREVVRSRFYPRLAM